MKILNFDGSRSCMMKQPSMLVMVLIGGPIPVLADKPSSGHEATVKAWLKEH